MTYHCDGCGEQKDGEPARISDQYATVYCPECFFEADPSRIGDVEDVMKFVDGARLDLSQTGELDVPKDLEDALDQSAGALEDCTGVASHYLELADEARGADMRVEEGSGS